MHKGKRVRKRDRSFVLLASLVLLVALGVGTTVAYLIDDTNDVKNTFTPASVPPEVTESFDGYVKENVKVQNTGNINACIRALVNVTWQDADGNVAPTVPVQGTDYSISGPESGWEKNGDYWYYTLPVAPGGFTSQLITEAKQLRTNGDYQLVIDIVSQTIQSDGTDDKGNKPIELAWGVDIVDGGIVAATIAK